MLARKRRPCCRAKRMRGSAPTYEQGSHGGTDAAIHPFACDQNGAAEIQDGRDERHAPRLPAGRQDRRRAGFKAGTNQPGGIEAFLAVMALDELSGGVGAFLEEQAIDQRSFVAVELARGRQRGAATSICFWSSRSSACPRRRAAQSTRPPPRSRSGYPTPPPPLQRDD